jgi:type II secretory pathway component PulK
MHQARHNSGIATFSAVVMLTIVMISVTGLTHYFAHQARYTRDEVTDAQLRQLLIAGEQWTRGNVTLFTESIHSKTKEDVPLPRTLRDAGASLRVERMSSRDGPTMTSANRNLNVRVTASLGDRQMSQVVSYSVQSTQSNEMQKAVVLTDARLQSGRKISPTSR